LKPDLHVEALELCRSPPMRGRGLKPVNLAVELAGRLSPPMRGRGLKQSRLFPTAHSIRVAPHAGAWIETCYPSLVDPHGNVAPHAGAWIETPLRTISPSIS